MPLLDSDDCCTLICRCFFFCRKACGGAEGMAGLPQAAHPVRTSWVGENDDAHVDTAGHAQPCAGQPELLELDGPQSDSAGDARCRMASASLSLFLFCSLRLLV